MRRQNQAFTLIELLVVISIISLLISLLLPALSGARNAARTVQCAANVRQVQMGLIGYSQDNRGSLPFASWTTGTGRNYRFWGGGTYQYVGSVQPYFCPVQTLAWRSEATRRDMGNDPHHFWWQAVGYGVNRYRAMPTSTDMDNFAQYPVNVDDRRIPTSQFLIITENYRLPANLPAGYQDAMDGYFMIYPRTSDRLASHRHDGRASVGFLDGHVSVMADRDLGYDTANTQWLPEAQYDRGEPPWFGSRNWITR